ncbi:MAG: antitoxin family protein [Tepidisphaeraceae bacterium]|jgi:predicted DNA-binding antitoxin AbrB/MazE fold protein
MTTINAIYRKGAFQPIGRVDLPEEAHVKLEFQPIELTEDEAKAMQEIYRIMGLRFNSGQHDLAERHNEHQP